MQGWAHAVQGTPARPAAPPEVACTSSPRRSVTLGGVNDVLSRLRGALIVSVQADEGSPMRETGIIAAMSRAALLGGARGLRLRGPEDIRAVRALTDVPVIGLTKQAQPGSPVYITATPQEVRAVLARLDRLVPDFLRDPLLGLKVFWQGGQVIRTKAGLARIRERTAKASPEDTSAKEKDRTSGAA